MEVGELFIKLGLKLFNVDSIDRLREALSRVKSTAEGVGRSLELTGRGGDSLRDKFNGLRLGAIGATMAVLKFSSDSINSAMNLDRLAAGLDIGVENLRRWQLAGARAGADVLGVLETIRKTQNDFRNGSASNVGIWQFLGLDIARGNPEEVLGQLIEKLRGTTGAARSTLLRRLGLDQSSTNLGEVNFSAAGSLGGIQGSDKDIRALKELNRHFVDLKISLGLLRDRFVANFSPIKYFLELLTRLASGFDHLIQKTGGWQRAGRILTGVLATLLLAIAPLRVAIVALALAVDDVMTYFRGGDSIIGELVKKFPRLGVILEGLGAGFRTLGEIARAAVGGIGEGLGTLGETFTAVFGGLRKTFGALGDGFSAIFGGIGRIARAFSDDSDPIGRRIRKALGIREQREEESPVKKTLIPDMFLGKVLAPISPMMSRPGVSSSNLNNYINIYSDQPPREIAREVGIITQDMLNRMSLGL
jgi:hypothetical protein